MLFPTAEPLEEAQVDDVAEVFASHANVYLSLVVVKLPIANIPIVPAARPAFPLLHPQLRADVAPNADGDGMSGSLKLG